MEEDMRDELFHYFERDIGWPPVGARDRVLAGLRDAATGRPSRSPQALAASVAAFLAMIVVAALLLLSRAGGRPQPAALPPPEPPLTAAAVAYDAGHGELVALGSAGTWTWDGHRWTPRHPSAALPSPMAFTSMAFDAANGTVVLFADSTGTWTWDGRDWSHRWAGPTATGPSAMAYDPASRTVLLYGSLGDGTHQLWSWDGATWTELRTPALPALEHAAMAWDGRRVLLAGMSSQRAGGRFQTETWAWDGGAWALLSPAVRLPVGTYGAASDQADGTVVVLVRTSDTQSSETWVWDGAAWRKEHPAHQPPAQAPVAYDAGLRRVVAYDAGLWTWDGVDWTLVGEGTRR